MCILCNTELKDADRIREIYCRECPDLKIIPYIPDLCKSRIMSLDCSGCPNLENIDNLQHYDISILWCCRCPKIKKIPWLKNPDQIYCSNCVNLSEIETQPMFTYINFSNCRLLTDVNVQPLRYFSALKCPWISCIAYRIKNPNFESRIEKLKKLQRWFIKFLLIKKLVYFIPYISEIYYLPGYKGAFLSEKRFYKCSDIKMN